MPYDRPGTPINPQGLSLEWNNQNIENQLVESGVYENNTENLECTHTFNNNDEYYRDILNQ